MQNRLTVITTLLLALFWSAPGFAIPTWTSLVVIGDSLSDQGNTSMLTRGLVPPAEYTDGTVSGRFTNGRNYIDYLSEELGLPSVPSLAGGSNYATGGARTDSASVGGIPLGPFGLLDQRDTYIGSLAPSGADPDALHIVWGGSNDLADIIDAVQADPSFDVLSALEKVVTDITDVISSIAAVNARDIVVPNVPNLGLVPLITGGGDPVPEATQLAALFNDGLSAALGELATAFPDSNLIEVDTFGLLTAAWLDPTAWGFSNATDACYSEFVRPGGTPCAAPDEYLSWDGYHPTTAGHRLIAASMVRTATEPALPILLLTGLAVLALSRRRSLSM